MSSSHRTVLRASLALLALLALLSLAACGGDPAPAPHAAHQGGRIYTAEEVQREALDLVALEAEARARFKALGELRSRLVERGETVAAFPASPGLPKDRHQPASGLPDAELAQRMARFRQANDEFARFLPQLDALRQKLLERSVALGVTSIAEQLDQIELRGAGALRVPLFERELVLDLVHVPPGRGKLGIDLDDPDLPFPLERRGLARVTTTPQVEVIVAEGFFLQRSELTRAELAVLRGIPPPQGDEAALPATGLTWREAMDLAAGVQHPQLLLRLPSEVEWEYAARYDARAPRFYPWGGMGDAARIGDLTRALTSAQHAGVDCSALGLLHLAGNAREWTLDAWRERRWEALAPRSVHHASRVEMPARTPEQVAVRGGAAGAAGALAFEAAWRSAVESETRSAEIGVRFVVCRRSAVPEGAEGK